MQLTGIEFVVVAVDAVCGDYSGLAQELGRRSRVGILIGVGEQLGTSKTEL